VGTLDVVAAGHEPAGLRSAWAAADAGRGAVYIAKCETDGEHWRVGAPHRMPGASLDLQGVPVLSADPLQLPNVLVVDPARALAAAVRRGLQQPASRGDGIRAVYVE
jgi:hypothetical protein